MVWCESDKLKGLGWKGAWPKGGGVVWCERDKHKRGWDGKGRGLREGAWFDAKGTSLKGWVGKGRGLREGAWFGAKGTGLEGVGLERGVA